MIYKNVNFSCLLPMNTYFNATLMSKLTVPAHHQDVPETGQKNASTQTTK